MNTCIKAFTYDQRQPDKWVCLICLLGGLSAVDARRHEDSTDHVLQVRLLEAQKHRNSNCQQHDYRASPEAPSRTTREQSSPLLDRHVVSSPPAGPLHGRSSPLPSSSPLLPLSHRLSTPDPALLSLLAHGYNSPDPFVLHGPKLPGDSECAIYDDWYGADDDLFPFEDDPVVGYNGSMLQEGLAAPANDTDEEIESLTAMVNRFVAESELLDDSTPIDTSETQEAHTNDIEDWSPWDSEAVRGAV